MIKTSVPFHTNKFRSKAPKPEPLFHLYTVQQTALQFSGVKWDKQIKSLEAQMAKEPTIISTLAKNKKKTPLMPREFTKYLAVQYMAGASTNTNGAFPSRVRLAATMGVSIATVDRCIRWANWTKIVGHPILEFKHDKQEKEKGSKGNKYVRRYFSSVHGCIRNFTLSKSTHCKFTMAFQIFMGWMKSASNAIAVVITRAEPAKSQTATVAPADRTASKPTIRIADLIALQDPMKISPATHDSIAWELIKNARTIVSSEFSSLCQQWYELAMKFNPSGELLNKLKVIDANKMQGAN